MPPFRSLARLSTLAAYLSIIFESDDAGPGDTAPDFLPCTLKARTSTIRLRDLRADFITVLAVGYALTQLARAVHALSMRSGPDQTGPLRG